MAESNPTPSTSNDFDIDDEIAKCKESRPKPPAVPPPVMERHPDFHTSLIVLLSYIIQLCESINKCMSQVKRFLQVVEDERCVSTFSGLRSCHRRCPIISYDHFYKTITRMKNGDFSLKKWQEFRGALIQAFKGGYHLEGCDLKYLMMQFQSAYPLIHQARMEMACLTRFNLIVHALIETGSEGNVGPWVHAIASFPFILDVAAEQWRSIAHSADLSLSSDFRLRAACTLEDVENVISHYHDMIYSYPKLRIMGGIESDSDSEGTKSLSSSSSNSITEEREDIIFRMKSELFVQLKERDGIEDSDSDQ